MKTLSLYVDKWFITVAVNIDGKIMPLSLPNGEDRIWLFFQEDIVNKRIVYGKDFEKNYRDRQPHYFGDIFNLIEQGDAHFTRYQNRPEEITGIFKVSNIFNDLHQAIDGEGRVDTYLSFSTDISDIARYKFIEELKEANFNVVESVARISYLALEESKKRSIFTEDGYYLSMVATNDNLHYALYEHTDGVFIRKEESSLFFRKEPFSLLAIIEQSSVRRRIDNRILSNMSARPQFPLSFWDESLHVHQHLVSNS